MSGPLPIGDNFFIVTDTYLKNIYQVNASDGVTSQLLPFGAALEPTAVAYDPTAKLIYWADYSKRSINRYSLLTNTSTVIYRDRAKLAGKYITIIAYSRKKLLFITLLTAILRIVSHIENRKLMIKVILLK